MNKDRLLSRKQIGAVLERLAVPQSAETLRAVIARLEIKPLTFGLDPSTGRGRVALYDPLLAWVLATYFHWPRLAAMPPEDLMRRCRYDAKERTDGRDDERTERLAYYIFLFERRYGIDLRVLDEVLHAYPTLLELSLDGAPVLTEVLRLYKQSVVSTLLQRDVDDVPLGNEMQEPISFHYGGEFLSLMTQAGLYDPSEDPMSQFELPEEVRPDND